MFVRSILLLTVALASLHGNSTSLVSVSLEVEVVLCSNRPVVQSFKLSLGHSFNFGLKNMGIFKLSTAKF